LRNVAVAEQFVVTVGKRQRQQSPARLAGLLLFRDAQLGQVDAISAVESSAAGDT
jgi:hypothetical protein